jgi:hypothetical protein
MLLIIFVTVFIPIPLDTIDNKLLLNAISGLCALSCNNSELVSGVYPSDFFRSSIDIILKSPLLFTQIKFPLSSIAISLIPPLDLTILKASLYYAL